MTVYQCLLELDELGYLKPLIRKGVISVHFIQWMEIAKMKEDNPEASYCKISCRTSGTKTTIFRALSFMNQQLT